MNSACRRVDSGALSIWLGSILLAFGLTYVAGARGFFAFDQSIVFDGSYRILCGQVPYSDFVIPFGPVTFWLHSLFFKLLGVSFRSYLTGSATVASLATLAALTLVRLIRGRDLLAELAAGVLTAVWFYPPFGTPWVDQTAFFVALLALVAVVGSFRCKRASISTLLMVASGIGWLGVFLSKQNVGAFIGPLFALAIIVRGNSDLRRCLRTFGLFAGGVALGALMFSVWLTTRSEPQVFTEYVLHLPSRLGSERMKALLSTGFGLLRPYFDGRGPWTVNGLMLATVVVGIVGAIGRLERQHLHRQPLFRLSLLMCIYLPVFQHVFINTTLNQAANGFAFAGVASALAVGVCKDFLKVRHRSDGSSNRKSLLFALIVLIVLAGTSISGIRVAMGRSVHDIFAHPRFGKPVAAEVLKPLRWAKPTAMGDYEITERSIVDLLEYLRRCDCNFFIFPDFTIFYGLLGVPSPQPVLWFHRDVTYIPGANQWLDRRIVSDLERNNVDVLVLEQVSWFNTGERLNDFPFTKRYLMANFAMERRIGTFLIYRRVRR